MNFFKNMNLPNKLTMIRVILVPVFIVLLFMGQNNPLFKYLANERKLKLKYDGKWYHFIIKERQENSSSHTYSFSCEDLFITELAKNGYNIEFDAELQNGQGTAEDLASIILDGTDWQVESDFFAEKIKETLYEITPIPDIDVEVEREARDGTISSLGTKSMQEYSRFSQGFTICL